MAALRLDLGLITESHRVGLVSLGAGDEFPARDSATLGAAWWPPAPLTAGAPGAQHGQGSTQALKRIFAVHGYTHICSYNHRGKKVALGETATHHFQAPTGGCELGRRHPSGARRVGIHFLLGTDGAPCITISIIGACPLVEADGLGSRFDSGCRNCRFGSRFRYLSDNSQLLHR